MNWINPKERKPEGEVFWALTMGRYECGYRDWEIRRLLNDKEGDYRTLDEAGAFRINTDNWTYRIYGWLPLEAIPINDKDFE